MSARPTGRRGLLLVLSSPSGAGKTTIARRLLGQDTSVPLPVRLVQADPSLILSVSVTTRPRRPGEVDGRDYWFIDQARFDEMVAGGEFLEHARVFGNCYGTPRRPIEEALAAGQDIVGDLDWQGTRQIAEKAPGDLVAVFVLPPSLAALKERLRTRAQDSDAVVAGRMAKSAEEMSHWDEYEYVIVNDKVEESVAQARAIVTAERLRRTRQPGLAAFVAHLRQG